MNPQDIISDEEIERVHAYATFGDMSKRDVVDQALLKCACGYHQGYTATRIILEHGLINSEYNLTVKGKEYLWATFKLKQSIWYEYLTVTANYYMIAATINGGQYGFKSKVYFLYC